MPFCLVSVRKGHANPLGVLPLDLACDSPSPVIQGIDMDVMSFVGVAILIVGVISLVLSTTVLFHRVPSRVRSKEWFQKDPETWDASVRLWIFIF